MYFIHNFNHQIPLIALKISSLLVSCSFHPLLSSSPVVWPVANPFAMTVKAFWFLFRFYIHVDIDIGTVLPSDSLHCYCHCWPSFSQSRTLVSSIHLHSERIQHTESYLTPGSQLSFTAAVVTSANAQSVGKKGKRNGK